MRIFPDDLDLALEQGSGIVTRLATELESPRADSLVSDYLARHFTIQLNGEQVNLTYLGKEPEADAIWCYLESDPVEEPKNFKIYNRILTEVFSDQVNIIQVYCRGWNKGLLLTGQDPEGSLRVGD